MKNWKKCLVSEASSIISAIRVIDLTEAKIAVIVDDDNHLKGTVTDYDVRKAILAGGDLHKNVQTIMNITPKNLELVLMKIRYSVRCWGKRYVSFLLLIWMAELWILKF